jgi:hypothetical protein
MAEAGAAMSLSAGQSRQGRRNAESERQHSVKEGVGGRTSEGRAKGEAAAQRERRSSALQVRLFRHSGGLSS